MSMRFNWLTAVLAVALLASVTASGMLLSSNSQLSSDNESQATKLQMQSLLAKSQMVGQAQIKKVDAAISNASMNLQPHGLNGTQARAVLNATLAADPYIVNVITYGRNGVVVAAEPSSYYYMVGMDLSWAANVQKLLSTRMPVMTDVLAPLEGGAGAVFAAPVFDTDGVFLGGASALFNASNMLHAALPKLVIGTGFTFWTMQMDGMDIYDTDLSQVGMNILYGPDYADFPNLQALAWRMVNESTGYGTYSYFTTLASQNVVTKQCFWTTIGAEGITWRLVIVHRA